MKIPDYFSFYLVCCGLLMSANAFANSCDQDENYKQFDFWLGTWAVYGNVEKTGPVYGINHIEKTENGCLIMEHWKGAKGSTGTSMNYYNGITGKWVQNWVSAGGTTIDYQGGLVDGSMVLTGKIFDLKVAEGAAHTRDF